jgi:hypothetical protein
MRADHVYSLGCPQKGQDFCSPDCASSRPHPQCSCTGPDGTPTSGHCPSLRLPSKSSRIPMVTKCRWSTTNRCSSELASTTPIVPVQRRHFSCRHDAILRFCAMDRSRGSEQEIDRAPCSEGGQCCVVSRLREPLSSRRDRASGLNGLWVAVKGGTRQFPAPSWDLALRWTVSPVELRRLRSVKAETDTVDLMRVVR